MTVRAEIAVDIGRDRRGIVHVVQALRLGGIETMVVDLAGARTCDSIVSLDGSTADLMQEWPALHRMAGRIIGVERRSGLDPILPVKLAARLSRLRPRAVVLHHIGPLIYGGAAARLAGVPGIIHVSHDAWTLDDPKFRRTFTIANRLIRPQLAAVSAPIANRISALAGRAVEIIPQGIDLARFTHGDRAAARVRLAIDDHIRLIGTVGRLVPEKAYDILIHAVRQLPAGVVLVIVGEGPLRGSLETLIAGLGLSDRVRLLGRRDDVETLLPALDVYCLSSRHEGLPRSVLEAQACGVPVVATDVGALRDAVDPSSGVIVPAGDAAALAAGLMAVLDRKPAAPSIRAFVAARYSLASARSAIDAMIATPGKVPQ